MSKLLSFVPLGDHNNKGRSAGKSPKRRRLSLESLENRELLSVAPLALPDFGNAPVVLVAPMEQAAASVDPTAVPAGYNAHDWKVYANAANNNGLPENYATWEDVGGQKRLTKVGINSSIYSSQATGDLDLSGLTALKEVIFHTARMTSLNVSGCTALTSLICSYSQVTSLNFSGCTALQELNCNGNKLTSLDVSGFTTLKSLFCGSNELVSLNISGCTALESLQCDSNQLASLNVAGHTTLKSLSCETNQLVFLDVSGCTQLSNLDCNYNQLSSLDATGCTALRTINCLRNRWTVINASTMNLTGCSNVSLNCGGGYYDSPTSFDLSGCLALSTLYCASAYQLTSLNVSGCTNLVTLGCGNDQIKSLNVSGCTSLKSLSCNDNQLTSLDVSSCAALESLSCDNNKLTTLNVSGLTKLYSLSCSYNLLTSLNASGCSKLWRITCNDNQWTTINATSMNLTGCVDLQLECNYNTKLTSIDFSGSTVLKEIDCYYNKKLTSVNVSGCTKLTTFNCGDSQLTSLNVAGCTALQSLYCTDGQLASIDLSGLTALQTLDCRVNQLTSLDVSDCVKLTNLFCNDNRLTSLDVSGLTQLAYLTCYNNQLTSLNVTGCTKLTYIQCFSNYFDFTTLLPADVATTYDYSLQHAFRIPGASFGGGAVVDLSSQYNIGGSITTYTWKYIDGTELNSSRYTGTNGKFVFNGLGVDDIIYCEMTNEKFPKLTLKTMPVSSAGYNANDLAKYNDMVTKNGLAIYGTGTTYGGSWLPVTWTTVNGQLRLFEVYATQASLRGALDLSGCTALKTLQCNAGQYTDKYLTSVNVSGCTALETLNCQNYFLTSLNFSGCTSLESLYCGSTLLTSLDVSNFTKLKTLNCSNNQLTSLNVTGCSALESLSCSNSQLTSLDLTGCTKLNEIYCSDNQLTSLDASRCPQQCSIYCFNNQLTFSSLLIPPNANTYYSSTGYQSDIILGTQQPDGTYVIADIIDLSSEYSIQGRLTTYQWFYADGTAVDEDNIIDLGEGCFRTVNIDREIYCEMRNATFYNWVQKTNTFTPGNIIKLSQNGLFRGSVQISAHAFANSHSIRLTWVSGGVSTVLKTVVGEGDFTWDTTSFTDGLGIIKAEYLDSSGKTMYYFDFGGTIINDPNIVIHRGTVSGTETWNTDKVHLVVGKLYVASGASVTIAENAVVKFWRGAYVNTLTGSTLTVRDKATITRAEDDFVEGDTNKDGNLSMPKIGNSYFRGTGTFNISHDAILKFVLQTRSGIISFDETWRAGEVIHVDGTITVAAGATLTIGPGAIVKFDPGCSLNVNGTLIAEGTAAQPIVFTSIKDDAYGGDTNDDGDDTRPKAGDWGYIAANGGTIVLNHTRVSYCSNTNNMGGLYLSSGSITFNNSIITNTLYDGMRSYGGTFTANNSVFSESSMGVSPRVGNEVFTNCTFANCSTAIRGGGNFINCVFSNISMIFEEWGPGTFQNCVFWNPKGFGPQSYSAVGSNGNIWADPLFRDVQNGDFHLRPGSPLIDAADSTKASTTDISGAPRVNDSYTTTKRGTPNADGNYADIGAYEFTDYANSNIDLQPINLQAPASAKPGDKVTLQWTVRNNGSEAAIGSWTDLILMVNDKGEAVRVGEVTYSGNIGGGDTQTFFAQVTVPPAADGVWRFVIQTNIHRNIFEGPNIGNNEISAVASTTVAVPLLTEKQFAVSVAKDKPQFYRVEIPAGKAFSLSAYSANAASILISENRAPNATSFDYAAATDERGNYALYVPPGTTARTFYLLISTDKTVANVSVNITEKTLDLISVAQPQVSNAGASTIGFIGGGFDATMTVKLQNGTTTISGTNLSVISGSSGAAQFNLKGVADGTYDLVVTKDGVSVTLKNAVTVTVTVGAGAKLEARFDIEDSVRAGRIYQGWIEYKNTGDCDMPLPVFMISSSTNTPVGLTADSLIAGGKIYVLGTGSPESAGVLRPGESGKVAFYYEATSNTNVNFGSWWDDTIASAISANKYWTTWAEYHHDISETVTQLYLRGYSTTDYNEVTSFLMAKKAGKDTTGLSGKLCNAQTGEAIANAALCAEWSAGGKTNYAYATTDPNGHYVFNHLPADGTITLSLLDKGYDLSETTVLMRNGNDVNGFNLTARQYGNISGLVSRAGGSGISGVTVFASSSTGESAIAVTDSSGFFLLESLSWGTWTVEILNADGSPPPQTVAIHSASMIPQVQFTLATTGNVTGRVLDHLSNPLAETYVQVVNEHGERIASGMTDKSGNYLIEGVQTGTYHILAVSESLVWKQQAVTVKTNETATVNLAAATATLSGKIYVSVGVPATSGDVVIYSGSGYDDPDFQFVSCGSKIGADGSYRFDSLLPGEYLIEVYTESGSAFEKITIGESSNSRNITLSVQTTFSGKVNFGTPIPQGEIIYVLIVSNDETAQILTALDEGGNFDVGSIPQGNYHITVISAEGILAEQDVVLTAAVQTVTINSTHVFPAKSAVKTAAAMLSEIALAASASGNKSFDELWNILNQYSSSEVFAYNYLKVENPPSICACVKAYNESLYQYSRIIAEQVRKQYNGFEQCVDTAHHHLEVIYSTVPPIILYTVKATSQVILLVGTGGLGLGANLALAGISTAGAVLESVLSADWSSAGSAAGQGVLDNLKGALDKLYEVGKGQLSTAEKVGAFGKVAGKIWQIVDIGQTIQALIEQIQGLIESIQSYCRLVDKANGVWTEVEFFLSTDQINKNNSAYQKCHCGSACKCGKPDPDPDPDPDQDPPPPPPPFETPKDNKTPERPQSCDPNEINGPIGYNFETRDDGTPEEPYLVITTPNWITDNRDQSFTIYFENKATAAAAAQEVFVEIAMPPQWDYDTFVLESICIGNQIFTQMAGSTTGTWFLQQDSTGEQIQLTVTLDTATGLAKWYLRSYVNVTADHFPADAYAGFLPPNDEDGSGQGYVKFGIRMRDGLETGTVVESCATIVFDTNEPIITNVWKNTIDSTAPTSKVTAFAAAEGNSPFTVKWSGTDVGSGISCYDIYVSIDGGEFTKWKDKTTDTSATYTGEVGKTYSFYSIAYDNVGLMETGTKSAEASVKVTNSTTVTQLAAPTNITATSKDARAVTVMWNAVPNASGYKIEYSDDNFVTVKTFNVSSGTATSADVIGLTTGKQYSFRVIAVGAGQYGNSTASEVKSSTPTVGTVNTAASKFKVKKGVVTYNSVTLDFKTDKNLEYVISYTFNGQVGGPVEVAFRVVNGKIVIDGLQAGVSYKFTIKAFGHDGTQLAGNGTNVSAKTKAYAAVKKFKAPKNTAGLSSITLGWQPSVAIAGATVTYELFLYNATTKKFDVVLSNDRLAWIDATNVKISGFEASTKYKFAVVAVATFVDGQSIRSKEAKCAAGTMKAPVPKLAAKKGASATSSTIDLQWTKTTATLESAATYELQCRATNAGAFVKVDEPNFVFTDTKFNFAKVMGLEPDKKYEFKIIVTFTEGDVTVVSESKPKTLSTKKV